MKKKYLSENADIRLIKYLENKGFEIELVRAHSNVAAPIAAHPDIYFCDLGAEMYCGDASLLGQNYPQDVLYNAARVGRYFICSKYTARDLINRAKKLGLEIVIVPQGYVKCNLVVVDDKHVITEDAGIAKCLEMTDIECLLISGHKVALPGYKYGFIGGASGRLEFGECSKAEILFNGDIRMHPDCFAIKEFISSCDMLIKYFDYKLTDIGSIL